MKKSDQYTKEKPVPVLCSTPCVRLKDHRRHVQPRRRRRERACIFLTTVSCCTCRHSPPLPPSARRGGEARLEVLRLAGQARQSSIHSSPPDSAVPRGRPPSAGDEDQPLASVIAVHKLAKSGNGSFALPFVCTIVLYDDTVSVTVLYCTVCTYDCT